MYGEGYIWEKPSQSKIIVLSVFTEDWVRKAESTVFTRAAFSQWATHIPTHTGLKGRTCYTGLRNGPPQKGK